MSIVSLTSTPDEAAEMEAVLTHTLTQIAEIREQMQADDIAIVQTKAENAALKAETRALREETRTIISGLRIAV